MMRKLTLLQVALLAIFGIITVSTQASAREVRNDMQFICKYEANRNYGVSQSNASAQRPKRAGKGFTVRGQSPRNTNRALTYQCKFDRWGEYTGIKKIRDNRYSGGGQGNQAATKTMRRICKGEASSRWRTRPNNIRVNKVKRLGS